MALLQFWPKALQHLLELETASCADVVSTSLAALFDVAV